MPGTACHDDRAVNLDLTPDDLREIHEAASDIDVQGARIRKRSRP
jgi:hypothetical protein